METFCLQSRPKYRLAEKIGEGGTSRVWRICDEQDCSLVMRLTEFDGDMGVFLESFEDSVSMQKLFASVGVSPKLVDSWICRLDEESEYGVMILEDAGVDLGKFLHLNTEDLSRILLIVAEMLDFIHSKDWYHGDVSPKNITLKKVHQVEDGFHVSLPDGLYRVYLIDTDESGVLSRGRHELFDENLRFLQMQEEILNPVS